MENTVEPKVIIDIPKGGLKVNSKVNPNSTEFVDEDFWKWLGGFFDGEGSLLVDIRKMKGYLIFGPRATVCSADLSLLKLIQSQTNMGKIYNKGIHKVGIYQSGLVYYWAILNQKELAILLHFLSPHLKAKAEQAKLLSKFLMVLTDSHKKSVEQKKECIRLAIELAKLHQTRKKIKTIRKFEQFLEELK